jgi:hypothetical protein
MRAWLLRRAHSAATEPAIVAVTLWSLLPLRAPRSLAWAIRAGLLLLVAGQLFGLLMVLHGGHTFGRAGATKLPHALGLHAAQLLPALGWLLRFADWSETRRTRVVILGCAGYVGLVAVAAVQMLGGLAPLDLGVPMATALGVSVVILGAAYAIAVVGLARTRARATPVAMNA